MHQTISATRRVALTTVLAAVALGAGGCGTDTTDTSASGGSGTPSSAALVLDDGWVKSVDAPRMGAPSPAGGMSMPMRRPVMTSDTLTLLIPARTGKEEPWQAERIDSPTACGLRVTRGGKTLRIAFRKHGVSAAEWDGVAFDGPVAVR